MNEHLNEILDLNPEDAEYLRGVAEANRVSEAEIIRGAISTLHLMAHYHNTTSTIFVRDLDSPGEFIDVELPFHPSKHKRTRE